MGKSELVSTINGKFSNLEEGCVELMLNCILAQTVDALVQGIQIEIGPW